MGDWERRKKILRILYWMARQVSMLKNLNEKLLLRGIQVLTLGTLRVNLKIQDGCDFYCSFTQYHLPEVPQEAEHLMKLLVMQKH